MSFKLLELTREFLDKFNVDKDILEEQECASGLSYDDRAVLECRDVHLKYMMCMCRLTQAEVRITTNYCCHQNSPCIKNGCLFDDKKRERRF